MPLTRRRARASAGLQRIEGARALDEVGSRGLSRLLKSSLLLFRERQTLERRSGGDMGGPRLMRVLTDDPRFTPLHHAIGHGELIDWAAVHEGSDARHRHSAMVHGLCGVGSETARLLMLCGLTRVVLNDDTPVTHEDLNTQLLLTDADVGRRRSEALAERLAVAFDGVSSTEVTATVGPIPTAEAIDASPIGVIIATTAISPMHELVELSDGLHRTSLVYASAHGAFAFVHASHVNHPAGMRQSRGRVDCKPPPPPALVESLTKHDANDGDATRVSTYTVTTCETTPHGLAVGDIVELVPRRRMDPNRDKQTDRGPTASVSASTGTHSFTATLGEDVAPGDCEYVRWVGAERLQQGDQKEKKSLGSSFQKLKDSSLDGPLAHLTLRYAADAAVAPALVRALPELDALKPGDDLCTWAGDLLDEVQNKANLTERCYESVSELARGCKVRIPAVCAVAASFATHQALRALVGHHADDGWIVYDCAEMIAPWGAANARKNPYVVAPSGVEGTRILLGSDAVDVLGSMRIALAGVGGIGREVLRLLALVGFGKTGGKLDAVDACDVFEHDLARGSLLRAGDVGTNKAASSVASVAQLCAARVNHARECEGTVARTEGTAAPDDAVGSPGGVVQSPLRTRLASDDVGGGGQPGGDTWTSHMAWLGKSGDDGKRRYDATLLEGVDAIVSCVDSLSDRRALDELSVRNRCALLDAGCDGDAVSCHVAVPHRTMPWSHGPRDRPEWEPPSCVLGNFPHAWVHASRWAKDLFLDLFVQAPADVNAYLRDSTYAKTHLDVSSSKNDLGSRLRDLRRIHAGLVGERPYEYSHCVSWAAARFEEYFATLPNQMLKNFPPEQTQKDGAERVPFWTGTKRVPAPITFDANVPSHVTFIVAAANLRAAAYGLRGSLDPDVHAKFTLAETKEKPDAAMDADTAAERAAAEKARNDRDEAQCATLLAELPPRETLVGFRVREAPASGAGSREPLVAAFVAAAASLRADVHGICKPLGDADGDVSGGGQSSSGETNDWLGLTATGARPGAPAAAALAGALVAIETHKLAAVKAASLRDESEALFGIIEGGVDPKAFVQRPFRHTYASVGDWTACVSAAPSLVQTQIAKTISKGDLRWSVWDVIDMDCRDGLTLQGFIERFEREVGLQCGMVSHGASLLYADFMNRVKIKERLESPLASAMKLGDDATHATLSVGACDENDDDVDIPEVRVRFR